MTVTHPFKSGPERSLSRIRKSVYVALLLVATLIASCGDSSSVFSEPRTQTSGFDTVPVRLLLSDVQSRQAGAEVDGVRLTGYGKQKDTIVFGPEARVRSSEVEFQVPISATRLLVEFLAGEQVVGVYSMAVTLKPGQELIISDPEFLDSAFPLSALTLSAERTGYPLEHPFRVTATGTFADGSSADLTAAVSFEVNTFSQGEAKLEGEGWVRGTREGNVLLVGRLFEFSPDLLFTITEPELRSLELNPAGAVLPAATKRRFELFALYNDGTRLPLDYGVVWSSLPSAIATVSEEGVVTAQMPGSCTVSAQFRELSAAARITVTEAALVRLSVLPGSAELEQGQGSQFEASGLFTDGTQMPLTSIVSWGSSDPEVVQVDDSGLALSMGAGQALVLANDPESGKVSSGVVNVRSSGGETPVATSLAFVRQPGTVSAGRVLAPVSVTVLDQYGYPLSVPSLNVTLTLSPPPMPKEPEPAPQDSGSASSEAGHSISEPMGSSQSTSTIVGSSSAEDSGSNPAIGSSAAPPVGSEGSIIAGSSMSEGSGGSSIAGSAVPGGSGGSTIVGSSMPGGSGSTSDLGSSAALPVGTGGSGGAGSTSVIGSSAVPSGSASTSQGSQSQSFSHSIAQALFRTFTADLTGTLSGSTVNGAITFSDLTINQSGTYVLTAAASGLKPATSTVFEVAP